MDAHGSKDVAPADLGVFVVVAVRPLAPRSARVRFGSRRRVARREPRDRRRRREQRRALARHRLKAPPREEAPEMRVSGRRRGGAGVQTSEMTAASLHALTQLAGDLQYKSVVDRS